MSDLVYNKKLAEFINEYLKMQEQISRQVYPKFKPLKEEMIISHRDGVSTTRDVGHGYIVHCMACKSLNEIGSLEEEALKWVLEHAKKHVTRCPDCKNNKWIHINRYKLDGAVFYRCPDCKTTFDNLRKPKFSADVPPREFLKNNDFAYFDKPIIIELISITDKYTKLKPGARGKVSGWNKRINDYAIMVDEWDQGGSLDLIYGEDKWKVVKND